MGNYIIIALIAFIIGIVVGYASGYSYHHNNQILKEDLEDQQLAQEAKELQKGFK